MNSDEQVEKWVKGESIHNNDIPGKGGECCPDFSCCLPELKADDETRERFYKAHKEGDRKTVDKMLSMFLGALISRKSNKKIHIAGDGDTGGLQ